MKNKVTMKHFATHGKINEYEILVNDESPFYIPLYIKGYEQALNEVKRLQEYYNRKES